MRQGPSAGEGPEAGSVGQIVEEMTDFDDDGC
jgi:hypothetical protein